MSEPAKDEERELTLSMYIDGELDPKRRQEVEEKLRSDPAWKAEYDALTDSDQRVSKVVQDSWHDPEFTGRVMDRVTKQNLPPAPEWAANPTFSQPIAQNASPMKDRRTRLLITIAAAASFTLFAVTLWFTFGNRKPPSNPLPPLLASAEPDAVRLEMDLSRFAGYVPGNIHLGQNITVKAESTTIKWADGTRLWLRQDASVRALGARSFEVTKGVFLIDVSRDTQPFNIKLPDESQIQVLGTRFEVDAKEASTRVRVLDGHVRRTGGKANANVEARGGEEITADFQIRKIDPREILIAWSDLTAPAKAASNNGLVSSFAAPWPQLGGTPGHTGVTPLSGPAGLAATRFIPFPVSSGAAADESTQYAPAVIGAGGRVFVLRREGTGKMQLYGLELEGKADPSWKPCGEPLPGNAQHPPVITTRGLVVAGASGNIVQAWDPEKGAVAWKKDVESSVYALCAAYDGNVYCSTYQRLVVLDGNGEKAWAYPNIKDVQAPVGVGNDGSVLVVARDGKAALLDRTGKLTEMLTWEGVDGENVFWPPVEAPDGYWVTTTSGRLAKQGRDVLTSGKAKQGQLSEWPTDAKRLTVWPLSGSATSFSSSIFASGNKLFCGSPAGPSPLFDPLPIQGEIGALAKDGNRLLYAGVKNTLYRLNESDGKLKDFAAAKKGEIVRGGIAIMPGRVIVTTNEGLQLFE